MKSDTTWNLHFHDELMARCAEKTKWTATKLELRLMTETNEWPTDNYGTFSDIYLDAYYGGTRVISQLLDNPGTDFQNGDDDTYYIDLTRNGQGIPLDQISIALRHTGKDKWSCSYAGATLYHGEVRLTNTIYLGRKFYENSTWWLGLENRLNGNYTSFTPLSLYYETNVDDGLISFMNSLDDSRQWENDANILWGNTTVRRDVFFKIFKGFSPEIEYSGENITIYKNEAFDLDPISFVGMWNGVREARRNQIAQMPKVKGTATISFINQATKETACSVNRSVNGQTLSLQNYSNEALIPGVYDVKVTYTPDSADPQYAEAEQVFEGVLTVEGNTATPVITYDEDTFTVQATGKGTVKLYVDGVEVKNPYAFEQTYEEQEFTVTATAQEEGKEISDPATAVIIVPPLLEVTDPPVLPYDGDTLTPEATEKGTVILYVDGEEVENPYTFEKTYD